MALEKFISNEKLQMIYKIAGLFRIRMIHAIFEWIETWYNRNRRHSKLKHLNILEFENKYNYKPLAV